MTVDETAHAAIPPPSCERLFGPIVLPSIRMVSAPKPSPRVVAKMPPPALAAVEEDNFFGKATNAEPKPERMTHPFANDAVEYFHFFARSEFRWPRIRHF